MRCAIHELWANRLSNWTDTALVLCPWVTSYLTRQNSISYNIAYVARLLNGWYLPAVCLYLYMHASTDQGQFIGHSKPGIRQHITIWAALIPAPRDHRWDYIIGSGAMIIHVHFGGLRWKSSITDNRRCEIQMYLRTKKSLPRFLISVPETLAASGSPPSPNAM